MKKIYLIAIIIVVLVIGFLFMGSSTNTGKDQKDSNEPFEVVETDDESSNDGSQVNPVEITEEYKIETEDNQEVDGF